MMPKLFLEELRELGFAGIQNFPTVGLFEGQIRSTLEETGMSYQLEVDITALAHEMDLLTTPYVFNTDEAKRMTDAGADIVVAHMGCTSGGTIGAESVSPLDECVGRIQEIVDACKGIREDIICLCHGGPIAMPEDADQILQKVQGIDGFYGASSVERFPAEMAIKAQVQSFKSLKLPGKS
jgi:predicted TIM-barrel enzyme